MKERYDGTFLVRSPEEYEEAIAEFLKSRLAEPWWREKLGEVPKTYPSICKFFIHREFWDITAYIITLEQYKEKAKEIWLEIEAL